MNSRRLRYYLSQVGSDDDRLTTRRSPNELCDDALETIGFSRAQITAITRARRAQRAQVLGESAIILTVNAAAFALVAHRFEQSLSGLSLVVDNWDHIMLAYSVADTIGWDTTAELMIVTAQGAMPFGTFLYAHSEEMQALADVLGYGAEFAAIKADLADALMTGGLSIALSAAAFGIVKLMNHERSQRLKEAEKRTEPVQQLHVLLASGALPQGVRKQLPLVPKIVAEVGRKAT